MDAVDLATLSSVLHADARVLRGAVETARRRVQQRTEEALDSTAYHLARAYNVLEHAATAVASAFENSVRNDRGWHAELLRRMALDIGGVRPALFPVEALPDLTDLRSFRHVVVHAYDLALDRSRVARVLEAAERVAGAMPGWITAFVDEVARRGGWPPPPPTA